MILGLVILASEFTWAQRLLDFVRDKVRAWTAWIGRQGWPMRTLVGLGTAACVFGALYGAALVAGVPAWVPAGWVPPLPGL